ncbi:hypothetical protein [Asanoa iriomotensis]|uniref:Tetratricopeptide repeat protein n=1 Tax=Asanoa iriomotensis TaxID=234613 RepID=A0ABQ4CEP1_9ACTN|nr:hypothetical protein [Asanoa iriomotensis]GIF61235.1 hypothetical protein Air01nite_73300 [Asanoa iriomotensis]
MSRQELAQEVNAYLYRKYKLGLNLDETDIGKLERGENRWPREKRREAFRIILRSTTDAELGFYPTRRSRSGGAAALRDTSNTAMPGVDLVRQALIDALREGAMAEASLEDWELTVVRYGEATRTRPPRVLLDDIRTDFVDLTRAIHRHRSASALRRLSRTAAQMSGLMTLTLCKLDHRSAFRQWASVARLAANESGDPVTQSWILAQEAYGHFYSGDLAEAIDVAKQAQDVVGSTQCVGAALAAALEARAYAVTGQARETRSALGRAENNLSALEGDALLSSAFGYNEAQLRFHEGNAYTYLGDLPRALKAQERALELCQPGDYTDWAMTQLDRAVCLATSGGTNEAMRAATEMLRTLGEDQRRGIITLRGHAIFNSFTEPQKKLPASREFYELLMLTTESKAVLIP